jgi:pimeloyl-ACP methyl ester carboxylesterase
MAFTFSKFLNNVAVPVAFSYAWVTGAVYLNQRKLQYFPDEDRPRVPTGGQFEHLREIELMSGADSKVVRSWWWPADSAGAKTVVYFHGNAGHRGHRLPVMQFLRQHLGVSVLMVGYRGYGGNEGSPSENGFYDDGDAALRWLKQEAGVDRAVLYGESIGTGVAVELATTASSHPERSEPAAVVLQSGFTSCTDVAADAYPFLPVRLLLTDTFESEGKIGRLGEGGGAAGAQLVVDGGAQLVVDGGAARPPPTLRVTSSESPDLAFATAALPTALPTALPAPAPAVEQSTVDAGPLTTTTCNRNDAQPRLRLLRRPPSPSPFVPARPPARPPACALARGRRNCATAHPRSGGVFLPGPRPVRRGARAQALAARAGRGAQRRPGGK